MQIHGYATILCPGKASEEIHAPWVFICLDKGVFFCYNQIDMAETIDLTITLGKACGTCKHYRNSRKEWGATKLIERFKEVPDNEGIIGGYCLRDEKIRLTARMGLCGAWEVTTNRTLLGLFKKRICQHEYVFGCEEKSMIFRNGSYHRQTYLLIRTAYYCKECFRQGPYEINGVRGSRTYYIYQSKTVRDLCNATTYRSYVNLPEGLEMTQEDKNPDYDELAEMFAKIKLYKPFPPGVEIKETWSTLQI